ncbi:hypothetical protein B0H16DRAFT_1778261 [Mycena metata]|uniref:DUF6534 domain-containing protein n=1 Tax=Mycena metata TaxID=1033252 RepID=A0AAD7MQ75_9AGAR|nr:hypothetical protein B0H16DRAFT_1778261 [Mycena metata]
MGANVGLTLGALLLGVLIASTAYGITIVQTYIYFERFPKDDMINKMTVWLLFSLETFHAAISWYMIYYYLILNFGNLGTFAERPLWSLSALVVVTHVIEFTRQCFYARRVYFLSGRSLIISTVILLLGSLGAAKTLLLQTFIQQYMYVPLFLCILVLTRLFERWGVTSIVGQTAADMVITATSIYYLKAGKTESLLDKLLLWTGSTGMLTSAISLAFLGAFVGAPDALIYLALDQILTRVYVNTLLATLNFRAVLRGRGKEDDSTARMPMSIIGHRSTTDNQKSSTVVHVVTHTHDDSAEDKTAFAQHV